jgi:hypothetical protein
MMPGAMVVATRYWGRREANLRPVVAFATRAHGYCDHVYIAVNVEADKSGAMIKLPPMLSAAGVLAYTTLLAVEPWGQVTRALNELLASCLAHHPACEHILFQSIEVDATAGQIAALRDALSDGQTLVAGAALQGHLELADGSNPSLATDAVPWNTLAIWRADLLAAGGGFPTAADKQSPPGMEEAGAIAAQQLAHGRRSGLRRAKLVAFCGPAGAPAWHIDFSSDPARAARHRAKMESKRARTRAVWSAANVLDGHEPVIELLYIGLSGDGDGGA